MTTSVEWDYFLSIEEDFIRTIPFVEPREGNFDTYSTQYAKILLAAASETDTVLKRLCKTIDPSCRKKSEQGYREFLVKGKRVPLLNAKAKSLRFGLSSTPWASYDSTILRLPNGGPHTTRSSIIWTKVSAGQRFEILSMRYAAFLYRCCFCMKRRGFSNYPLHLGFSMLRRGSEQRGPA